MDDVLSEIPALIFQSVGITNYSHTLKYGYKLIVEVDQGISEYYRSLIPKCRKPNSQMYAAHISVVRKEIPDFNCWGAYEGKEILFDYVGHIFFDKIYCWLNVFSKELENIRLELNLPVSSQYTRPPEGSIECFHCTLGNFKGQRSS